MVTCRLTTIDISLHRCDVSYSEKYEAMEDQFITIAKDGDKAGVTYKMNSMDKDLLDTFMLASNNANMFGKTNVDKNGRPTIFDPEDGQPKRLMPGQLWAA